jgi:NTP pyrophosphatase (non-canonical NTP hydrolase)
MGEWISMNKKQIKKINLESINAWGAEFLLIKMIEESNELGEAIASYLNGLDNIDHVKEEVADVLIMAGQLRTLLGEEEIDNIFDKKMDVTKGLLKKAK